MLIYNIFPLLAGHMKNWNSHTERAKEMGFDWIYLNPVGYPGFSGSIYSIKDFYRFNPVIVDPEDSLDGEGQFRRYIEYAHNLGMKIMLDLVVNHTAIDSPLTALHRNWYRLREDGSIANPEVREAGKVIATWGDLAEIDNENSPDRENLWEYWARLVEWYISLGVDGFRCDAAYMVPNSLWQFLFERARRKKADVVFMAESLGCRPVQTLALIEAGFDYVMNSSKYWNFYDPWCLEQNSMVAAKGKSVAFPESHDTERLMEELSGHVEAVKCRYIFSAFFSTGVMIPIGFEYGFRKRLNVVRTRPQDWEYTNIDLTDFIRRTNQIKKTYTPLHEDSEMTVLEQADGGVLALRKVSRDGKEVVLLLLNKDFYNYRRAYFHNLAGAIGTTNKIFDISPDYPMDELPWEFEYYLRPAQVKVLYSHL